MWKRVFFIVLSLVLSMQNAWAACGGCRNALLLSPNGSEIWHTGENQNIVWDNSDTCANNDVDIYYSTDSGVTFPNNIALGVSDNGVYNWFIPSGINSSQVRIRIVSHCISFGTDSEDTSDADFSILSGDDVNMSDVMTDSLVQHDSGHLIRYSIGKQEVVSNGSIKISWANEFDFSALASSDISVSGGDVVWGIPQVNNVDNTVIISFVGDLNKTDGTVTINTGLINQIINPVNIGSYDIEMGVYSSSNGTGLVHEDMKIQVATTNGINVTASVPQSLTFVVYGVNSGQNVNGVLTNVATTSSEINFGQMNGAGDRIGAQDLSVSTNATNGYSVNLSFNHNFTDGTHDIDNWVGTNTAPTSWSAPGGGGIESYFGYTSNDQNLGNVPIARFISNKWAGLSTVSREVMFHDGVADGTTPDSGLSRVGYRLQITNFQSSGNYATTVTYLCVPSF